MNKQKALMHGSITLVVVAGIVLASNSCGGPKDDFCPDCKKPPTVIDPATTGSVKGKAVFKGTPPKRKKVAEGSLECAGHGAKYDEQVIVNDGMLVNVLVRVKSGLAAATYAAPMGPASVDNVGCMYSPRVAVALVHQEVMYKNSDPAFHNISIKGSRPENLAVVSGGTKSRRYHKPETMELHCDIHPWMLGWLVIVDNPYYAVSGPDGSFEIKGVPAGEVELEAWHEKYGPRKAKVKIEAGKTAEVDYTFEP